VSATLWRSTVADSRFDIRAILRDPVQRRALLVKAIYSTQAQEDPTMTMERAEAAYDAVQRERAARGVS
jgi:hypothetical protein